MRDACTCMQGLADSSAHGSTMAMSSTAHEFAQAIDNFVSKTPGVYTITKHGRQHAEYDFNAGAQVTEQKLLWTRDNVDFCRLVNAKQDGSETGDGVDHTDADWITRAQYNLSYVTQPNIVLATYKRKGQWLPRMPGLLVQMAVDDTACHQYSSADTTSACQALALSMLFFYGEYYNVADLYQIQVDARQLYTFGEQTGEYQKRVVETIARALEQIIVWRRTATSMTSKNIKSFDMDVDGSCIYEVIIARFKHPTTGKPLTVGQLSNQETAANRHYEHSQFDVRMLDQQAKLEQTTAKMEMFQHQINVLRATVQKNAQSQADGGKKARKPTKNRQTDPSAAIASALAHSNARQKEQDRRTAAHEFLQELKAPATKSLKAAGALDEKERLILDEVRGPNTLMVLESMFVDKTDPLIQDVGNAKHLKSDVYIKLVSHYVPQHVKTWAAERRKGRPSHDQKTESHHTKGRDDVKSWLDALRDQCKLPSQAVIHEQDLMKLNIYDFVRRAEAALDNMPTMDQVKIQIDFVYEHFSKPEQARALRKALEPYTAYWEYRGQQPGPRLNRLRGAQDRELEWKFFTKWACKKGQIEAKSTDTFSTLAVARAEETYNQRMGIMSPPATTKTVAAVQNTHTRAAISETCGKCGTPNHTTDDCQVTAEQAAAGLNLHATLTNWDRSSSTCPNFRARMDTARKLGHKPSTSGIFGPNKFGCPTCAGKGEHNMDHWVTDCPRKTSNGSGGGRNDKKRTVSDRSVFVFDDPKKKKKRRQNKTKAPRQATGKAAKQRHGKQVTFTMTAKAADALVKGNKDARDQFAAFHKEVQDHENPDSNSDTE